MMPGASARAASRATCAWVLVALAISGCVRHHPAVAFHEQGNPAKLSDWNVLFAGHERLELNAHVVPYDLNTPLFSDYAHKLRTVWLPRGRAAHYSAVDTFEFPVGTIITKTFYYPRAEGASRKLAVRRTYDQARDFAGEGLDLRHVHLVETRLLVRRATGWVAIPYVWNAAQTDAELARTGDEIPLELVADNGERTDITYVVPNANQCQGCHAPNHTTRVLQPLGPTARHLNRDYAYGDGNENQLLHLQKIGYLAGLPRRVGWPRNANWLDADEPLEARARAYLDVNCGHCHNPHGPAKTSGLWLDAATKDPMRLGLCKPPVAAGQGTGDFNFDIVPGHPERSILTYRMESTDPGAMMPELGRSTTHAEGIALVTKWIAAWPGQCDLQTQ
jgi:uncharacterized repeat protein (TIGR03806 family)